MTGPNDSQSSVPHGDAITAADPANVPPNRLFRLVIVFSAAFLLTILLLLATTFSSSRSSVKQYLDLYGLQLIGVELVAILIAGFFAMAVDRRQTLVRKAELRAAELSSRAAPPARESEAGDDQESPPD